VSEKKVFLVNLRRITAQSTHVEKSKNNSSRFKLNLNFRRRYIEHLEKGKAIHLAEKHAMTTRTKNPKKSVKTNEKAKMSKTK
jgi:hypothetical protein